MYDIFRTWRSTSGMKLISGLLKYNPKERWTANEALKASYFTELVSLHEHKSQTNQKCHSLTSILPTACGHTLEFDANLPHEAQLEIITNYYYS